MSLFAGCFAAVTALTDVDPLIGTTAGGHCFPGVATPFGMIQAGPDTDGHNRPSGYDHADKRIRGFSQTHLNGTGCAGLGDLMLMPFSSVKDDTDFSSAFSKNRQFCEVDRYRVHLDDFNVDVEATCSPRVGWWRFTYSGEGPKRLLVDAATTLLLSWAPQYGQWIPESEMAFSEDCKEIYGSRRVKGWSEYKLYYVVRFDHPYTAKRMLARDPFEGKGDRVVCDFNMKTGETLGVQVALSLRSVEGARKNLDVESAGKDFETVRCETRAMWNDVLSRMTAEGGTAEMRKNFATALYHLFLQPNIISDVGEEDEYSTFSLWDTFRAAHPLYTILVPEKVPAFVRSLLKHGKRHGHLPMWEFWGEENHCMVGWPAIPVVVDAILKGLDGGVDRTEVLHQVIDTLTRCDERHPQMTNILWEHGYLPFDKGKFSVNFRPGESVSRTLEIAYDWACARKLAAALGNGRAVKGTDRYINCWKNLWDEETGFMRPKSCKGEWMTPFTPTATCEPTRDWPEYTEASAWIYTWHVFLDPHGLATLMGGPEKACAKLDEFFNRPTSESSKISQRISGQRGEFWHGNEPSHHIPYLYALWGQPEKTEELVREICTKYYEPTPDGLCGNEDCGQMSAWYLFSAAGFYPFDPCGGDYILGAPQFDRVTFRLDGGKAFVVTAKDISDENKFVAAVSLNGSPLAENAIRHTDIMRGGELKFVMKGNKGSD